MSAGSMSSSMDRSADEVLKSLKTSSSGVASSEEKTGGIEDERKTAGGEEGGGEEFGREVGGWTSKWNSVGEGPVSAST